MQDNLMKALFLIVVMIVLFFQSIVTSAQTYKGLTASFGVANYSLKSDLPALEKMQTNHVGGRIGLLFGGGAVRTALVGGYYSSTAGIQGTIDRYSFETTARAYPLAWMMRNPSRLRPYITGGLSVDNFRFHGYYINREPGLTNYSQAEAPYLGSVRQIYGLVGGGLEFSMLEDYDFVHIYSDFSVGASLSATSSHKTFTNTSLENNWQVNIGIAFGLHR